MQLTIPTICTRNVNRCDHAPEDLRQARRAVSVAMSDYFKNLRTRARVADSIVRKSLLLSKKEYVIEQTITIEFGPSSDKDWTAVVWLDCGRDLGLSVEGPWCPRPETRPWETYFCPVIVHEASEHPFPSTIHPVTKDGTFDTATPYRTPTSWSSNSHAAEWRAAQNICLLPFQYGSKLDKDVASQDALYAVSEVFQFAASAESQFLNLLQRCIKHELAFIGGDENDTSLHYSVSLLNLKYIKTQLTSHVKRLAEAVSVLRNRSFLRGPHMLELGTASRTADSLLADFEYLQQRADTLARECEQGMATLANSTMLKEARLSAAMGMRVQRLTFIATIFIPLSFVCSIWGMNFKELGSGTKPLWMWFASAAPVVLFALIMYTWDALFKVFQKPAVKVCIKRVNIWMEFVRGVL